MYKLGEIFLIIGICIFAIGGIGRILNLFSLHHQLIPVLAALALLFIGVGISIKKKYHK